MASILTCYHLRLSGSKVPESLAVVPNQQLEWMDLSNNFHHTKWLQVELGESLVSNDAVSSALSSGFSSVSILLKLYTLGLWEPQLSPGVHIPSILH